MNNLAEYIKQLTDIQGISVATVTDGWVLTFTKEHLQKMLQNLEDGGEDKEYLTLHIKSSALIQEN